MKQNKIFKLRKRETYRLLVRTIHDLWVAGSADPEELPLVLGALAVIERWQVVLVYLVLRTAKWRVLTLADVTRIGKAALAGAHLLVLINFLVRALHHHLARIAQCSAPATRRGPHRHLHASVGSWQHVSSLRWSNAIGMVRWVQVRTHIDVLRRRMIRCNGVLELRIVRVTQLHF